MNPMIPSPHAPQPSALSKLSLRDKLLLAQAVHEIGTSPPDWGRVSALLLAHPLIRQQSRLEQAANAGLTLGRIFGTRECERAWTALMRQRGLVLGKDEAPPEPPTPTTPKPKEPRGLQPRTDRRSQLALAQLLYAERMEELKDQIREKEEQFKSLVKEIDEIKSGQADARLEMELRIEMENLANGPPLPPSTPGSAAPSVAGPPTPASTASTTPKSGKKGRARGESSATTPAGDLSKASPTRTDSAPNSAKAKKAGDRRPSIDTDSPTKLIPGPTTLPSTPSISLPRPSSETAVAPPPTTSASSTTTTTTTTTTVTATEADPSNKPAEAMTTEEAEQAVATAATEAAVKVLQDDKAASEVLRSEVDKAAERVVETETNLELSAQAEGSSTATVPAAPAASSTAAPAAPAEAASESTKSKPNEAPAAEVVVKEKEPVPETAPADKDVTSAAEAASNKRKRDDEEEEAPSQPQSATTAKDVAADLESPVKKARTAEDDTKVPSSDDEEMDSEDEAEAAVGADSAAPSESGKKAAEEEAAAPKQSSPVGKTAPTADVEASEEKNEKDGDKEGDKAMDEDSDDETEEAEDQVKSVESPRKRTPAKEDEAAASLSKESGDTAADEASAAEPAPEPTKEEKENDDNEEDEDAEDSPSGEDDGSDTPKSRPTPSRSTPLRNRYSSSASRAKAEPTPPVSERDRAAKRKTAQVLSMLLTEVSNHTHGNLFHAPIKEQDAPDYYTLIKQPLDIKTIKARIKEGSIGSAKQLRRALALMFANSLIYNRPGTEVHRMATEMFAASEEIFRRYEGTQRF